MGAMNYIATISRKENNYFKKHFVYRNWIFGSVYCSINSFTSALTVSVSVFTLLALTVERHKAIMTPLAPRKSHKTLWVGIVLIWTVGTVVALPAALFATLYTRKR